MKNQKLDHLISRRHFISSVMFATTGATLISACKKSHWQIGCYTRPWTEHDYRVAFDGIAEAGFKFTGLSGSNTGFNRNTTSEQAAEIGEEAKSRGLEIASAYSNFDVRKSVAEGIVGLKRLIDNCVSCGCPSILLGGIAVSELVAAYYKVIAECCDYAGDKGVGINIKPHGGTNATGAECRMHIEKVGHKNFRLWYDPGNIFYYSDGELDPVEDAAEVDGLVAGMCVKDFLLPKDVHVTPGKGMVDFPKLLARLRLGGFTGGPLIIECLSQGDVAYINAEAKKACQFLEEITS